MTKDMFLIRAKNKCGFSDSQAKALFKLYEDDPTVDRDDTGPFGQNIYYIPRGIIKEFRTEDVIENIVDHESSNIKNSNDQDFLMLETHAT